MLNMIKGCRIHDPSVLFEGYEQIENGFMANVHAEKIQSLFEDFIKLHNEMCFVILEIPTKASEEPALQSNITDGTASLHKDVYYLDGLTPQNAIDFLNAYGEWVFQDGMSRFGIGIHSGANEILSGAYNVVTVYTKDIGKYSGFFEARGIPKVEDLKTAWNYFTHDTPGDSFIYSYNDVDIYGLVEHLKQYGLYFAERRENYPT